MRYGLPVLAALLLAAPAARAQYVYAAAGISSNETVGQPLFGAADVELDYTAALYYYPRIDGYLIGNGQTLASNSQHYPYSGNLGCASPYNGYPFDSYLCLSFKLNAPSPIAYSSTYYDQTNAWVTPYRPEVNSTIVFQDPYGYSLDYAEGGDTAVEDPPDWTCYEEFVGNGGICAFVPSDIYVASVYIGFATPAAPPTIGGIQVNGVVTNTIIAGTSGYMSIYGTNMEGATAVNAPPGVTITSFQVYNNGTQINAYFQASSSAATGQHNVTVTTTGGTSNGLATVTVQLTLKSFTFTGSVAYSRDCSGGYSPIAAPSWPATTGLTCPQVGFAGDHAVYVAGQKMQGNAVFTVSPAPTQAVPGVYVQGATASAGNFTASNQTIAAGATTFNPSGIVDNTVLPAGTTQFYDPLSVNWSIAQSGGSCSSGCAAVGTSSNPVYVTLATPTISFPPLMLTYVALGVGGGGATTQQTAFNGTWGRFAGPANVKTWDNWALTYYPGLPSPVGFSGCATSAQSLVTGTGSGQCGAFQLLLQSALQVDGIPSTLIAVMTKDGTSFMVNAWNFTSVPPTNPYPGYSWKVTLTSEFNSPAFTGMVPPNAPPKYGDLTSSTGIAGQNSPTPSEKLFGRHFILSVSPSVAGTAGPYFDPSYGVTYAGQSAFEGTAVGGYAAWVVTNYTGTTAISSNYGVRRPSGTVNICFAVESAPGSWGACN
jgi:hypothetical protein